jgi:hypothetical protein
VLRYNNYPAVAKHGRLFAWILEVVDRKKKVIPAHITENRRTAVKLSA